MFEEMKTRHLLGFNILAFVVAGIGLMILSASGPLIGVIFQLLLYVVVPFLFFRYHFKKQQLSIRHVVFTTGVSRWVPSLVGLVLLSIAFSLSVFWFQLFLLMPISPGLVDFFLEPIPMPDSPWYLAFTIVSITVVGPIAEEFIFRGVFLKRMMVKTSMWGGIVISSILFGILHADILGAFLFGVIASLLYLKTDNLLIPILFHIFNNSIAVLFSFVAPTFPEWLAVIKRSDISTKATPNTIVLTISAIIMGWVVVRLARGLRKKATEEELIV